MELLQVSFIIIGLSMVQKKLWSSSLRIIKGMDFRFVSFIPVWWSFIVLSCNEIDLFFKSLKKAGESHVFYLFVTVFALSSKNVPFRITIFVLFIELLVVYRPFRWST